MTSKKYQEKLFFVERFRKQTKTSLSNSIAASKSNAHKNELIPEMS